jgi:hypothetical protein
VGRISLPAGYYALLISKGTTTGTTWEVALIASATVSSNSNVSAGGYFYSCKELAGLPTVIRNIPLGSGPDELGIGAIISYEDDITAATMVTLLNALPAGGIIIYKHPTGYSNDVFDFTLPSPAAYIGKTFYMHADVGSAANRGFEASDPSRLLGIRCIAGVSMLGKKAFYTSYPSSNYFNNVIEYKDYGTTINMDQTNGGATTGFVYTNVNPTGDGVLNNYYIRQAPILQFTALDAITWSVDATRPCQVAR